MSTANLERSFNASMAAFRVDSSVDTLFKNAMDEAKGVVFWEEMISGSIREDGDMLSIGIVAIWSYCAFISVWISFPKRVTSSGDNWKSIIVVWWNRMEKHNRCLQAVFGTGRRKEDMRGRVLLNSKDIVFL